jgi:hypothetical protein
MINGAEHSCRRTWVCCRAVGRAGCVPASAPRAMTPAAPVSSQDARGKIWGSRNAMSAPLFAMTGHLRDWAAMLADTFLEA